MSVQTALQFIQRVRADVGLKSKLLAIKNSPDLETLVKLGAEAGVTFTVEELQAAHKHDWAMRWLIYNS